MVVAFTALQGVSVTAQPQQCQCVCDTGRKGRCTVRALFSPLAMETTLLWGTFIGDSGRHKIPQQHCVSLHTSHCTM